MLSLGQESWDEVAQRIARAEGPIAWAWLAVRVDNAWELIVLTVRGSLPIERRSLEYSSVIIRTQAMSPRMAARHFREGVLRVERNIELPFRVEGRTSVYRHTTQPAGPHLTRREWPSYVARFHRSTPHPHVPDRYDPLTARGQPYFASVMTAAAELLYGVSPSVLGNDLSTNVTVVLPDRRARIRDVRFERGRSLIQLERGESGRAGALLLRATWREEPHDAEWHSCDVSIDREEIALSTEGIPAHMSMAITDASGAVLDRYEWDSSRADLPDDSVDSPEQIQRWLSEGEGETLECKETLDSESVKKSVAETIAAFANGQGGVVLIGVTDDYNIVGYDPPFSAVDQITSLIEARITEPPTVHVERIMVDERAVYVVRVAPGDAQTRPHLVGGRVYHRANSRTRPAFPSEIRAMTRPDPQRRSLWPL